MLTAVIILSVVLGVALILSLVLYFFVLRIFNGIFRRSVDISAAEERVQQSIVKTVPERIDDIRLARETLAAMPYEELSVKSRDGLTLRGRLYRTSSDDAKGSFILVHGYQSSGEHDYSCVIPIYLDMGYNALLIDQRAHGRSDGRYICFGAKERYDVVDWCRLMSDMMGEEHKLILSGISMGATSVMLAASDPDLPKNVVGAIADCGYSSPYEEFCHVMKTGMKLPVHPLIDIAQIICKRRAGFGFRDFSTECELKKVKIPMLFIHGEADDFVLPDNTERNYRACASRKDIITVPGAMHGLSWLCDTPRCQKKIDDFIASL